MRRALVFDGPGGRTYCSDVLIVKDERGTITIVAQAPIEFYPVQSC